MSTPNAPWLALAIGNSHLHWGLFIGDRLHHTWDTGHLSAEEVNYFIDQGMVDGGWWMVNGEQGKRSQASQSDIRRALSRAVSRRESGVRTVDSERTIQNPKSVRLSAHDEAKIGSDFGELSRTAGGSPEAQNPLPLHIASVVPNQAQLWTTYPHAHFIHLADVPIQGMYSTFGLDRALTLWAAILTVGSPVLVIDAGTAITFTAADHTHTLIGGAILPGLRLQLESLGQNTALPPQICRDAVNRVSTLNPQSPIPNPRPHSAEASTVSSAESRSRRSPTPDPPLPPYWNLNTPDAIASGILRTILAGIRDFTHDWWQKYPDSPIVMTGGDGDRFYHYLIADHPDWAKKVSCDRTLIFKGIQAVKKPSIEEMPDFSRR